MQNNNNDKRIYQRVKGDFNIKINLIEDGKVNYLNNAGKSINVSASGVLLFHDEKLELGSIVNVKFLKPNSFDFFEGVAKVVRVEIALDNSYEIGISFDELDENDRKILNYYLTKNIEN